MDSKASFTAAGGLAMALTSTRCCFFIELTAIKGMEKSIQHATQTFTATARNGERNVVPGSRFSQRQGDAPNSPIFSWNPLGFSPRDSTNRVSFCSQQ